MSIDIVGARKAGYSDSEIISNLSDKHSFNLDGARKAGYADADILSVLLSKEGVGQAQAPPRTNEDFSQAMTSTPAANGMSNNGTMYPAGITGMETTQEIQNTAAAPRVVTPLPILAAEQVAPDMATALNNVAPTAPEQVVQTGINPLGAATSGFMSEAPQKTILSRAKETIANPKKSDRLFVPVDGMGAPTLNQQRAVMGVDTKPLESDRLTGDLIYNTVVPAPAMAMQQTGKSIGGLTRQVGDIAHIDAISDLGKNIANLYEERQKQTEADYPLENGSTAASVRNGITSFVQMLGPMALSAVRVKGILSAGASTLQAAKIGSRAALLPMAGMTEGDAYDKYRDKGHSITASNVGAGTEALFEYWTEKMGMGPVMKYMTAAGKQGIAKFIEMAGKASLGDQIGEQVATLGQSLTEKIMAKPDSTNAERMQAVDNYFTEAGPDGLTEFQRNAKDTLISTTTMNIITPFAAGVGRRITRPQEDITTGVDFVPPTVPPINPDRQASVERKAKAMGGENDETAAARLAVIQGKQVKPEDAIIVDPIEATATDNKINSQEATNVQTDQTQESDITGRDKADSLRQSDGQMGGSVVGGETAVLRRADTTDADTKSSGDTTVAPESPVELSAGVEAQVENIQTLIDNIGDTTDPVLAGVVEKAKESLKALKQEAPAPAVEASSPASALTKMQQGKIKAQVTRLGSMEAVKEKYGARLDDPADLAAQHAKTAATELYPERETNGSVFNVQKEVSGETATVPAVREETVGQTPDDIKGLVDGKTDSEIQKTLSMVRGLNPERADQIEAYYKTTQVPTQEAASPVMEQPWEMTKKEYADSENELPEAFHFNDIVNAIREGKPVPPAVLAEYPVLKDETTIPSTPLSESAPVGVTPALVLPKSGLPFKTEQTAKTAQTTRKMQQTHEIVPYQGGFALSPKGEQNNGSVSELQQEGVQGQAQVSDVRDEAQIEGGDTNGQVQGTKTKEVAGPAAEPFIMDGRRASQHREAGRAAFKEGKGRTVPSYVQPGYESQWADGWDQAQAANGATMTIGPAKKVEPKDTNTIFTKEAADAARARLKAKGTQLNSGIDPEMMMDGIALAGYHIEKGARKFAAFVKAMADDLGNEWRPYFKQWYMGVKFDPKSAGIKGMDSASDVESANINTADDVFKKALQPVDKNTPRPILIEKAEATKQIAEYQKEDYLDDIQTVTKQINKGGDKNPDTGWLESFRATAVKENIERIADKLSEGKPLTDALRSTILTINPKDNAPLIIKAMEDLGYTVWEKTKADGTKEKDIDNLFDNPDSAYKHVAIKFVKGENDPAVKELLIITPNMFGAKNKIGHTLYDLTRELDKQIKKGILREHVDKSMPNLREYQEALYGEVINGNTDLKNLSDRLYQESAQVDASLLTKLTSSGESAPATASDIALLKSRVNFDAFVSEARSILNNLSDPSFAILSNAASMAESSRKALGTLSDDRVNELIESSISAVSTGKNNVSETSNGVNKNSTSGPNFISGGNLTVFASKDQARIEGHYAAIEITELITSNDTTGAKRADYPQELQPRDRTKNESMLQINGFAANLNPEQMATSTKVSSGAPFVSSDGVVESGNGRTLGLMLSYDRGTGTAIKYRKWMADNAAVFGLKASDFDNMKQPMLVRVRDTEVDRAEFARQANQSGKAVMSDVEVAKADAARITPAMIDLLNITEDGNFTSASNRPFSTAFLSKLGSSAASGLVNNGNPTKKLGARIEAALFYVAYKDDRLLDMMALDPDADMKNIISGLTQAIPEFVKLDDASVAKQIVDAIGIIQSAKDRNLSFNDYVDQQDMFAADFDANAVELARQIDGVKRSGKKLAELFRGMAAAATAAENYNSQDDLFGDKPATVPTVDNKVTEVENTVTESTPAVWWNTELTAEEKAAILDATDSTVKAGAKWQYIPKDIKAKLLQERSNTGGTKRQSTDPDAQDSVTGQSAEVIPTAAVIGETETVSRGPEQADGGIILGIGGLEGPGTIQRPARSSKPRATDTRTNNDKRRGVARHTRDVPGVHGLDYRIPQGGLEREGSWKVTASRNLDIIALVKSLEKEGRDATPAEQELLSKYTGFGASEIANKLFPGYTTYGKIMPNLAEADWKPLVDKLQEIGLSPEELKTIVQSTQYAHYTSEGIVRSIYAAIEKRGFAGGTILDPGMGSGNFQGAMPDSLQGISTYTGLELDHVTASIAKYLYPNQNIIQGDYTKQKLPKDFFDLAIGNPPFASIQILSDPEYRKNKFSLHDYFFAKTIDRVRPGGLMVFITSRYTMDKVDDKARKYLTERADLVGAIRLPQTAFKQHSGTEVVTDIIFLRKRLKDEATGGVEWGNLSEVSTPEGPANINEYYANHPEMVVGSNSLQSSMYGPNQYTVLPTEGNIDDLVAAALDKLPAHIYDVISKSNESIRTEVMERDFNPTIKKEGGVYLKDGVLMRVESGAGQQLDTIDGVSITAKQKEWLTDYVPLRDALKQSKADQWNEGNWEKSLADLQKIYKAFVKKHGKLNQYTNVDRKSTDADGNDIVISTRKITNRKISSLDIEGVMVMALETITENGDIKESAALTQRTIKKPEPAEITSVADALAVSLDKIGVFNLAHIVEMTGMDRKEVISGLGTLIYKQPNGQWELTDEYLSGDVVLKLEEAQQAARSDDRFMRNVEALSKVQPKPLTSTEVSVKLGATWLVGSIVEEFGADVLGIPLSITYNQATGKWGVSNAAPEKREDWYYGRRGAPKAIKPQGLRGSNNEWSTPARGANEIIESILNNRAIKVTYTDPDTKKIMTDTVATAEATEKAKEMKKRFSSWIWEDAERSNILLDEYNRRFNNIAPRRFDGSHLTMPGVSAKYKLHPHVKRAIWRIIQTGDTYLAHAVGAGKTFEMIGAGMEMKRLGMISKPLYVVPNHMLQQFTSEFQDLYPMANIMVADEENFHTDNRRRFMAQAAMNNPDAIVITHASFGKMGMKGENVAEVRNEILAEMREYLVELTEEEGENGIKTKQFAKRLEALEQRFDSIAVNETADQSMTFEELGVDFLFVDEAHEFRKLDFVTSRPVKGVDPVGSKKALDLYVKTRWLQSRRPGRAIVFASGTPITNTLGELYTVQKFFNHAQMEKDGIHHFDAWAAMFGEVESGFEANAAGNYEVVERFSKFDNLPELGKRVREFMDVLTSDQLSAYVTRPEINGGKPEIVITPNLPELKAYQEDVLQPRITKSKAWKRSKDEPNNPDPIIAIIADGRLAALDMRFIDNTLPNNPNSKLNVFIDGIIASYKEGKDLVYYDKETGKPEPIKGASQIVFYNNGFGESAKTNRGFDSRNWLMKRLKAEGVPASAVAWIDDYTTAEAKEGMMKAVRSGAKRILIGSAKKMGTGMNVQNRLETLHYLDPPWYPSDIIQPDGRILRQGNQNTFVTMKRYATKGSYDTAQYAMVSRKAKGIESFLNGDDNVRSLEDVSESNQFAMASALASGDQRVIQLAGLNADIDRLSMLQVGHVREQADLRFKQSQAESNIKGFKNRIAELKPAAAAVGGHVREFTGKVGKEEYDNRFDFGQALLDKHAALVEEWAADSPKKGGSLVLGSVNGFDINLKYHVTRLTNGDGELSYSVGLNQISTIITDKVSVENMQSSATNPSLTDSARGLSDKIINGLNGVDIELKKTNQKLEEETDSLKVINKRLGAPFSHAQELAEKISEAQRLQNDLLGSGVIEQLSDVTDSERGYAADYATRAPMSKEDRENSYILDSNGMQQIYENIMKSPTVKAAMAGLKRLGSHIYATGKTAWKDWFQGMKSALGKVFSRYRAPLESVYKEVSTKLKEERGSLGNMFGRTIPTQSNPVTSSNPDVEDRYQAAKGLGDSSLPLTEQISQLVDKALAETQHFPALDMETRAGKRTSNILRVFESAGAAAKAKAVNHLQGLVKGFTEDQMDLFTRSIILGDLMNEAARGHKLPFGYDPTTLIADYRTFSAAAAQDQAIQDALQKRKEMNKEMVLQLVENDLLSVESVLKDSARANYEQTGKYTEDDINTDYYRHQVLAKSAAKAWAGVSTAGDVRNKKRGWMKERHGSDLDINTNFLEAEFEWFTQSLKELATKKALNEVLQLNDMTAELKAEARSQGVDEWETLIPDDHVAWQPVEGSVFYRGKTMPEELVTKFIAENPAFSDVADVFRDVMILGGRKKAAIIPIGLAETLDNLRNSREDVLLDTLNKKLIGAWKVNILLNPHRVIKYNLNNMSGDMDAAIAADPKILEYLWPAYRNAVARKRGRSLTDAEIDMIDRGVLDSGISINEIPDINKLPGFKHLSETARNTRVWDSLKSGRVTALVPQNMIAKYFDFVSGWTQVREGLLREAAYLRAMDLMQQGKTIYWASDTMEINSIVDIKDKAAKLSRELLGDYGNLSAHGERIRTSWIPFWSWMEINAPRYYRIFKNSAVYGEGGGAAAARISGIGAKKVVGGVAGVASKVVLTQLLFALVTIFNRLLWPDEEEALGENGRKQLHIIVGKTSDGKILSVRFQGAFSDALSWFGLEDYPNMMRLYSEDKMDGSDIAFKMLKATPTKLFSAASPFVKQLMEQAAGVSFYPDPLQPRQIRDRGEHLARFFAFDAEYKTLTGKPSKGYLGDAVGNSLVYKADPGEQAYNTIQSLAYKFQDKYGKERGSRGYTKQANALYYYRQAKKYKDEKAAEKYMQMYLDGGGKRSGISASVRRAKPMASLPTNLKYKFRNSLSAAELKTLERANEWYRETYQ